MTAKTLKEDILEGFKIGADDYITKPFSMEAVSYTHLDVYKRQLYGRSFSVKYVRIG